MLDLEELVVVNWDGSEVGYCCSIDLDVTDEGEYGYDDPEMLMEMMMEESDYYLGGVYLRKVAKIFPPSICHLMRA